MELVPVEQAAEMMGLEAKRLRGFMFRNGIGDPIGDGAMVYGWSCKTLAQRLADTSSAMVNSGG